MTKLYTLPGTGSKIEEGPLSAYVVLPEHGTVYIVGILADIVEETPVVNPEPVVPYLCSECAKGKHQNCQGNGCKCKCEHN